MSMISLAMTTMLIYAALVAGGGIIGYVSAKSKGSLIMGMGMGTILAAAWFFGRQPANYSAGLGLALIEALVLLVFFAVRYTKTRKVMPAGAMVFFSLGASVVFALGLFAAQ